MHSNKTVRSAALLMVALFMFVGAGSARADGNDEDTVLNSDAFSNSGVFDHIDLDDSWERGIYLAQDRTNDRDRDLNDGDTDRDGDTDGDAFDNRRVPKDKSSKLGFISLEINLGGGLVRSLDAGPEISTFAAYGYGNLSLRFAQMKLSSSITMQLGLNLSAEGVGFDSRQYEGQQIRFGAGPEFAFLMRNGSKPTGMAVIRLRLGGIHEDGESTISNYELSFQDSSIVDIEGFVETYVFEQKTGGKTYSWGGRQVTNHSFLHATQLRYRLMVQLGSERHEPGFNEGRNSNNSRYEFALTQWIYRTGWEQGELALGAFFEVDFSHAAGYRTVSHDNIVTQLRAGPTVRAQLLRQLSLYISPSVGYNARVRDGSDLDGFNWGCNFNLSLNIW